MMKKTTCAAFIFSALTSHVYAGDANPASSASINVEEVTTESKQHHFYKAKEAIQNGDIQTLEELNQLVYLKNLVCSETGNNWLHIAAKEDRAHNIGEITKFLLEKGIDKNAKNNKDETPIDIAYETENHDFMDAYDRPSHSNSKQEETQLPSDSMSETPELSDSDEKDREDLKDLEDGFKGYMGAETRGRYEHDREDDE